MSQEEEEDLCGSEGPEGFVQLLVGLHVGISPLAP